MFSNKGLAKRVAKAVDPCLRPGEEKVVSVYLHDPGGVQPLGELLGMPLATTIKTWILTLTDARVLIHEGNATNAARSQLLGELDRARVGVLSASPSDAPKALVLSFDGEDGHRFIVPLLWRKDAARFADELGEVA